MQSRPLLSNLSLGPSWGLGRSARWLLDTTRPIWRGALVIEATVAVDRAAAARWLPPSITPRGEATLFVADYPDTSFGVAYRECGLLLHGLLRGREVVHCAWMLVDDDTALILGRELLGFPKKLGEIDIGERGGEVEAVVSRRGAELVRMRGRAAGPAPGARVFGRPIVNVRGVPGLGPPTLWQMDVPSRCREAQALDLEVQVRGTEADPLDELRIDAQRGRGLRAVADVGLPPEGALPFSGIRPVGVVTHGWLIERLPLRAL